MIIAIDWWVYALVHFKSSLVIKVAFATLSLDMEVSDTHPPLGFHYIPWYLGDDTMMQRQHLVYVSKFEDKISPNFNKIYAHVTYGLIGHCL